MVRVERQMQPDIGTRASTAHGVSAQPATAALGVAGSDITQPLGTGVAAREQVLLVLRNGRGEAIGKHEILAVARVAEVDWPRTIRALLESGQVEQVGARRGARYRIPG